MNSIIYLYIYIIIYIIIYNYIFYHLPSFARQFCLTMSHSLQYCRRLWRVCDERKANTYWGRCAGVRPRPSEIMCIRHTLACW